MPSPAKNWHADQLRFQAWLALPKSMRQPKTQQKFAQEVGVHESTLSDWKRLEGWAEAVNELALMLLREDVPEILASLRREAKRGSAQHQRMALEMIGLYTARTDITSGGEVLRPVIYLPAVGEEKTEDRQ